MTFNLATAAFFSALVEAALCIGMFTLWTRDRARYLIYWSFGFLAFGTGALLIMLRDQVPDFLSIILANVSTSLSSILFYAGICLYYKKKSTWLYAMLFLVFVEAVILAYFTYLHYNTSIRIYIYNTAQVLIVFITLLAICSINRDAEESPSPELIIVTTLFLITHSARIFGTPFFPAPRDFLASGNFQTLLAFGLMVIHIAYSQVFANMHAYTLNAKISKALIDARTKDRQKVELLGYIGHDLRAPLAAISGYSGLLLTKADEEERRYLRIIQRNIKYQLDLIDELLEYVKSELKPLAVRPQPTELHMLVNDISDYAFVLCAQKNNRFLLNAPAPLPLLVNVDGKRLQQALLNLLSNAAKFTSDGTVELHITASCQDRHCTLQFTVSDTGIGIDLSERSDIFDAFQQVQANSGGTGLGLFIAQHVVSAMGSTLNAHSTLGKGSAFSFQLSVPQIGDDMFMPAEKSTLALAGRDYPWMAVSSQMLEDASLQQLEYFAEQGRWSDIQLWIEHHAEEPALGHLSDELRQFLDRFDFPSIVSLVRNIKKQ